MKKHLFRTTLTILLLGSLLSCKKDDSGIDETDTATPWKVALTAECTAVTENQGQFRVEIAGVGRATIDWGDGSKTETVTLPRIQPDNFGRAYGKTIAHTYRTTGTFSVSISGRMGEIDLLYCDGPVETSLDPDQGNKYASLELTNCSQLEYLHCSYNRLSVLDVSECSQLVELSCERNRLETLDLSNKPNLESVWCERNRLTMIDIQGCSRLRTLNCAQNALTATVMNRIYQDLPTVGPENSPITGAVIATDPEVVGDYAIAQEKGWFVDFVPSVPVAVD